MTTSDLYGWWWILATAIGCGGGSNDGGTAPGIPPAESSSGGGPRATTGLTESTDGPSSGDSDSATPTTADDPSGTETGEGDPPGCVHASPLITSACLDDEESSLPIPCGEELTLLAIAAYESDLPVPDATQRQVAAYLNEPGFEGGWSTAERLAELTGERVNVRFVTEFVQLPRTRAEYEAGANVDWHADAVRALIDRGFDFGQLSTTADGTYYPLFSIAVGDFWSTPHAGFWLDVEGRQFEGYLLTYYEPGYDVGVITHEFGHALFRWGEYYGQSPNGGVGDWGIMATGFASPYNPFLRQCKGWTPVLDIHDVYPPGTRIELPADGSLILRFRTPERPNEYFLIEARQHSDRFPDLPDEGILIWHVDEAMPYQLSGLDADSHNRVSLEQADGLFGIETEQFDYGGPTDAFRADSAPTFGATTTPSSAWWDGSPSGLELSEMSEVGPRMSFVLGPAGSANGDTVALDPCPAEPCGR